MGRAVFLLSLAAFASAASLRATDPLLPQIADDYGVTTGAASAAITAFALSYGLLQVVCGPLGDRFGRYRTIAAAALVSAFGSAACALAPTLESLVAARFVSGATIGAFIPLALAWIGDTVVYEQRQPLLARFLVGQMAGVAFGNAAAGWLGEHFGWRAIFMALAALLLLIATLLCMEIRTIHSPRLAAAGPARCARASGACRACSAIRVCGNLFATAYFEGLLIFGALAFVAAYFQSRFAIGPGLAGTLVAAYAPRRNLLCAARAPRSAAAGRAGPGLRRRRRALRGLCRVGDRRLAFDRHACIALVGAGFYMLHTTVQIHVTQVRPEERGSAVALFATFLFLGQASGVWLAARIVDAAGMAPVFLAPPLGLAALAAAFRYFLSGAGGT